MADILSIGASAAQLYRQALSTVSNNIANLNTEGYSKQTIESTENMPSKRGVYYVGTGSTIQRTSRAHDEFAEANLRTAQSDLASQDPIIKHTNKILNYLGSETTSLSSAFDKFFFSLSRLTSAPYNATLQQDFMANAEYVAARFGSTSAEMGQVDLDVKNELQSEIDKLNEYAEKLGALNLNLVKHSDESQQPSALVDQRDHLMLQMSKLAKIDFDLDTAGIVSAKFEGSSKNTVFIDRLGSTKIGVQYSGDSTNIVFDPYGKSLNVGSVQGGSISGLVNLRSNIVEPLRADIDIIVSTFVNEVNKVHAGGLTQDGKINQELFRMKPEYTVTKPDGSINDAAQVTVSGSQEKSKVLDITWNSDKNSWLISDGSVQTLLSPNLGDQYSFKYEDLSVVFKEPPLSGQTYQVSSASRPADSVELAIQSIDQIATSNRLIIESATTNTSTATAGIDFGYKVSPPTPTGAVNMAQGIPNYGNVVFEASGVTPSVVIPSGNYNFEMEFDATTSSDFSVQVLTSDKNHIVGKALTNTEILALNNEQFFNKSSRYHNGYLNKAGTNAFLDSGLKLGNFNTNELTITDIPLQSNSTSSAASIVAAGQITLNDITLGQLSLAANASLSAKDIATWLNTHTANTSVTASARNIITIDSSKIDTSKNLYINNVQVTGLTSTQDANEIATKINGFAAQTNVLARVDGPGVLKLYNTGSAKGNNIALATNNVAQSVNALGLTNSTYTGQLDLAGTNINFGFVDYNAGTGKTTDLAKLGLSTKLVGAAKSMADMAVFITGADGLSVKGSVDVLGVTSNSEPAIEDPFNVKFTSNSVYQIIDTTTDTIVAERDFDFNAQVVFNDVKVSLDKQPANGDIFQVTVNANSAGDNSNLQRLALIQDAAKLGGVTLQQGYEKALAKVGAVNSLAKISEEALEVVYEDAVTLESSISGVSLDDEAADLIRFQQSFQGAAQVIKISSTIFDSILSASR